jgi:hypothetical protein
MLPFVAQPVMCANPAKEETLGIVFSWIANNVKSDSTRPLMKKHGLDSFLSSKWYPTQTILDVIRDVYKEAEAMDILVAIGKQFAKEYPFDSSVKTIKDAIFSFNETYRALHRGMNSEEGIIIAQSTPDTLLITNNTPLPGEIIFGMLFTLPHRFEPGRQFSVKFLEPDDYLRAVIGVTWK